VFSKKVLHTFSIHDFNTLVNLLWVATVTTGTG
jgi:hypothetical protein